jgi:hypothetical protein
VKATCHFWCAPSTPGADHAAEDIRITVFLPFMPARGLDLKVTPEGDFYTVEDVFWDISAPDEVEVFFREPEEGELAQWESMREQGWRIE